MAFWHLHQAHARLGTRQRRGPRRRSALMTSLLVVVGAGAVMAPDAAGARRATAQWARCVEAGTGTLTWTASGPLTTRQFTIDYSGFELVCRSSDPSIHSATVHGVSPGTLNCIDGLHAEDAGAFVVKWNNGKTSTIDYAEISNFGFGHSSGKVSKGEFKGQTLRLHDLEGATPNPCVLDRGQTMGFYTGLVRIG